MSGISSLPDERSLVLRYCQYGCKIKNWGWCKNLLFAKLLDLVRSDQMLEVNKVVVVLEGQLVSVLREANGLDDSLELGQPRRGLVVAEAQPVHDKGAVIWNVTKVTSIAVVASLASSIALFFPQTVVGPLPNETTL